MGDATINFKNQFELIDTTNRKNQDVKQKNQPLEGSEITEKSEKENQKEKHSENSRFNIFGASSTKDNEITYNSCSVGTSTDKNQDLKLTTFGALIEDKGIKVDAVDVITKDYQEGFVYE